MDTALIVSIIGIVATPVITAAFVFGVMRGTINGLKDKVDKLCEAINITHGRIDSHLESHCKACPGTRKK